MAKVNLADIRQKTEKDLIVERNKKQEKLIEERSALAGSGKKNSLAIKKLKREIAQIETILTEKLYAKVG